MPEDLPNFEPAKESSEPVKEGNIDSSSFADAVDKEAREGSIDSQQE